MDNMNKEDVLYAYRELKKDLKGLIRKYYNMTHLVMDEKVWSRQDRNLLRSSIEHLMHFESCMEEIVGDG